MKKLTNKLSLHVPCCKYADGVIVDIDLSGFKRALNRELQQLGLDAYYTVSAEGCYKGRVYPQEIITVFFNEEDVLRCFVKAVYEQREQLQQEAYAYELNGEMYVYTAEEFYKLR